MEIKKTKKTIKNGKLLIFIRLIWVDEVDMG